LWRWTFGRFASHRRLASDLRQLDGQLKRQAASQRRAIAREPLPVGRYAPVSRSGTDASGAGSDGPIAHKLNWLRPALIGGSLAAGLVALMVWAVWPSHPVPTPGQVQTFTAESFVRVWDPLARQAERTGQALRTQTTQVVRLQQRLPAIDRVVNDLGEAIQTPFRDEVQRMAQDLRKPWTYLAGQLPRLPRSETQDQDKT